MRDHGKRDMVTEHSYDNQQEGRRGGRGRERGRERERDQLAQRVEGVGISHLITPCLLFLACSM